MEKVCHYIPLFILCIGHKINNGLIRNRCKYLFDNHKIFLHLKDDAGLKKKRDLLGVILGC